MEAGDDGRVARWCGAMAALIGIAGLIGWYFTLPVLKSIVPGYKPIAISAAIVFILLGEVQFFAARAPLRREVSISLLIVALLITLFGLLEIVQLATGMNVTIEDAILKYYPTLYADPDVHISPVAGIFVFLLGLGQSLYLYQWVIGRPMHVLVNGAGLLGSLVILGSSMFLLSYLYRTPFFYNTIYIPIAALAVLASLMLGIGLVATVGDSALPLSLFAGASMRARLLRAFLPLTAGLLLLATSTQYFLTRLTPINPAVSAPIITILFLLIISVVIVQVARVTGNLIDRAEVERRQAEDELRRLADTLELHVRERTAALEASNKELEGFSYSVAHDLRSPLRSVDGFSRYLLEHYADRLDARGLDYLQRMRMAAQRMGRLIDDLLNLARLSRVEVRRERVNLSALATAEIAALCQREPERRVNAEITPDLIVYGDQELLRIALGNLLENAWKFTSTREVAQITVSVLNRAGERIYFLRDNGVGFDMAYVDKLFQPFQRLHTEEEFPGTGIGLALVQRIVQRHGGRIWAEGTPGQGATFYFMLGGEQ